MKNIIKAIHGATLSITGALLLVLLSTPTASIFSVSPMGYLQLLLKTWRSALFEGSKFYNLEYALDYTVKFIGQIEVWLPLVISAVMMIRGLVLCSRLVPVDKDAFYFKIKGLKTRKVVVEQNDNEKNDTRENLNVK